MTIVAYGYARSLADFQFGQGGVGGGEIVVELMAEPDIVLEGDNYTLELDNENIEIELEPDIDVEVEVG